jgi:4-amino-4-deoxy-L-arabinose transferase-like glycosyltransferase
MKIIKKLFTVHGLLFTAIALAAILRLWNLGSNPPSLTPDEAALGYNAYSILKTGKDEHGTVLPIIFKSFGDFKPGLYVYLTIPSIAIFGLNEFATRLPSALAGVISVFLVYLIIRKLEIGNWKLGIIAAFVAAINPFLIYFSRGAWEANVSLTLTLFGIYFFLKAVKDSRYLLLSTLYFALTLVTYQGAKLSTAIVLFLLIAIYWKDFWNIKLKYLLISLGLGIVISIPIILSLFNGQTQRLTIYSIFSFVRPETEIQTYSDGYFWLFHSNALNHARMVASRWFNFYSGQFLVFEGDVANPRYGVPYQGVLLMADLFMLLLGLFTLFKNKMSKPSLFIFLWLILAPFSAALSRDQTNAVRSLNAAIPLIVIISFGFNQVVSWISIQRIKFPYYILLSTFYFFSFVYFLDAIFVHLPAHNSSYWKYGYKEAVSYITEVESKYTHIIFEQSFDQPYIYFLFHQKYSPTKFQDQANLVSSQYKGDVGFQTRLDNIRFEQIDWSALKNDHNVLVVSSTNPEKYPVIKEINYLNGRDVAFNIIEIK